MCEEKCVKRDFEAEYHEARRIADDLRAENIELKMMVDKYKTEAEEHKLHIATMKNELNRLSGMVDAFHFVVTKGRKQNDG